MSEDGQRITDGNARERGVESMLYRMDPDLVAPAAAYLAHESCTLNGEVLIAGGGDVMRLAPIVTRGISRGRMLSVEDVLELLGIPLLGVIPESKAVLLSSNKGTPAILDETTDVAQAYIDVVSRFLGEERQHRFIEEERRGFFGRLFG